MDLKDRIAVVTGASSGIGHAIAVGLAAERVHLLLAGRDAIRLRKVALLCAEKGGTASCYPVDLMSSDQVSKLGRQILRDWGHCDFLIHSAGIIRPNLLTRARIQDFDLQYYCNVRAPFVLTQALLPGLIRSRGQIVFINSTAGLIAASGVSQYAATKHALKALADSFREELNPHGIRVVSIYLGRTATPMQAKLHKSEGKPYRPGCLIQPEQVSAAVIDALRIGQEAEMMDIRIRPFKKPKESEREYEFGGTR